MLRSVSNLCETSTSGEESERTVLRCFPVFLDVDGTMLHPSLLFREPCEEDI